LPAMTASRHVSTSQTPSPASRLLQIQAPPSRTLPFQTPLNCRSWLASEGGLTSCITIANAIASKPAPTNTAPPSRTLPSRHLRTVGAGLPAMTASRHVSPSQTPSPASRLLQIQAPASRRLPFQTPLNCRSWLASDDGLTSCITIANAIAGKPAPTNTGTPQSYVALPDTSEL